MSREIRIPYRTRDEPLTAVAAHVRHLRGGDRDVIRELVLGAHLDGMRTAGELIDHVGSLTREQRRKMVDRARVELGLPSIEEVEAHERMSHIRPSGLASFPVLESELPPHLRGMGLGE